MTTLACQKLAPHPESPRHQHAGPWLVWLHGLLGSGQDWLPVETKAKETPRKTEDQRGRRQQLNPEESEEKARDKQKNGDVEKKGKTKQKQEENEKTPTKGE